MVKKVQTKSPPAPAAAKADEPKKETKKVKASAIKKAAVAAVKAVAKPVEVTKEATTTPAV